MVPRMTMGLDYMRLASLQRVTVWTRLDRAVFGIVGP